MVSEAQRTIALMRKAYDQPILFHILHSHLAYLLSNTTPTYEIVDEWSKILVYSAYPNKIPNQALELKIQALLKRIRPPMDTPESKMRLMVICYYLLNRPPSMINNIVIFELVSNFLGHSEYFDGLILKISSNLLLARTFGVEPNKKLTAAAADRMAEIILTKGLAPYNRIRALPCLIDSDTKVIDLALTTVDREFVGFKTLEIFCLYAKYVKNTSSIKETLPSDIGFIEALREFMSLNFSFSVWSNIDLTRCLVEDRSIYDRIRQCFQLTHDKPKFVSDVMEFLSTLR